MNERIKELRKALGLTQQAFADRLGIRQNTIAKYETNRGNPTTSVVALICREFNVSEQWLREGTGEMFLQRSREDEIAEFCKDITAGNPDFRKRFISALAKLNPEQWRLLEEVTSVLIAEVQAGQSAQQSNVAEELVDEETLNRYKREARAEADEIYEEILQEKLAADATEAFGQSSGGMSA